MEALRIGRQNLAMVAVAMLCTACFGSSSEDEPASQPPPPVANPPPPPANNPPTISGTPPTSLVVGENYSFTPTASDPDGDTLTFSIQNRPTWATFSTSTGRLSGTPQAGDVGQFSNVRISVSDGRGASAQLNAFSIAVNQVALGSVTLSWSPPTTNADGTAITNLAGYRIYYGRSSSALDSTVVVSNPGTTRWVIDNLSQATWYFSMTSYNTSGIESTRSPVVSRSLT